MISLRLKERRSFPTYKIFIFQYSGKLLRFNFTNGFYWISLTEEFYNVLKAHYSPDRDREEYESGREREKEGCRKRSDEENKGELGGVLLLGIMKKSIS